MTKCSVLYVWQGSGFQWNRDRRVLQRAQLHKQLIKEPGSLFFMAYFRFTSIKSSLTIFFPPFSRLAQKDCNKVRDHPFSTFAKCSEKLIFFTISFSETFTYVLNEWSLNKTTKNLIAISRVQVTTEVVKAPFASPLLPVYNELTLFEPRPLNLILFLCWVHHRLVL